MTKRECLNRYFEVAKEAEEWKLYERLNKLVDQDRITTGAAYYVYSEHQWYGNRAIAELLNTAGKSKNYLRCLKRTSLWNWNYLIKDIESNFLKAKSFVEEQESLPFEQTQKQLLPKEENKAE